MEVIHYFLIFLVINLGVLYWFQRSVISTKPSTTSPSIVSNHFADDKLELPKDSLGRLDDIRSCQGGAFVNNKCRLAGLAGPATGFHQAFSPSVNRELGWRNYYVRKFGGLGTSQNPDNGIMGSLTQNYLDSLPSTDNIYKQTEY